MKLSKHNGRVGKNGVYNPKHNDRRFDIGNSEHIDTDRSGMNVYWDLYQGYRIGSEIDTSEGESPPTDFASFEEIEKIYYTVEYSDALDAQNARHELSRHYERIRSMEDVLKNPKTCPEETILQIGDIDEHISGEDLLVIAMEYFEELDKRFGEHFHILDWALHVDEGTPHIHERHVFDCLDEYGLKTVKQEKALETMGFELPNPNEKRSRTNNRKMQFDKECRQILMDITDKYKLELDKDPVHGGRQYLEKQDYILKQQQEKLESRKAELHKLNIELMNTNQDIKTKESELSSLTERVGDMEKLVDSVTDAAYKKAVDSITEDIAREVHKKDMEVIDNFKSKISENSNIRRSKREFCVEVFDSLEEKMKKAIKNIIESVKNLFLSPSKKDVLKEEIKKEVRPSIRAILEENKKKIKESEGRVRADRDLSKGMER